jgi:4'-phosphopantetheinyl transferase EntD
MCSMNPPFMHIITMSQTFSTPVNAAGGQLCSAPVLLDLSVLENKASLDETQYEAWLTAEEMQLVSRFKLAKRKKEWLAGRICAKMAIIDYFHTFCQDQKMPVWNELSISNSDNGRPFPHLNRGERLPEGLDISISHSGSFALALAARTCCGVDIQKTSDTLVRIKERFCTDQEEYILSSTKQKNNPLMPLALLWAAKEAAKKALSVVVMPGFLDLVLDSIEKTDKGKLLFIFKHYHRHAHSPAEIRVVTACYQNYALGICVP